MIKETIGMTSEAIIDEVIKYISKLDYYQNTLEIDVDGELKTAYENDRENFVLSVRDAIHRLYIESSMPEFFGLENNEKSALAWEIADKVNIILISKNIKKIQDVTLQRIPQFCDVIVLGKGERKKYVRKAFYACKNNCNIMMVSFTDRETRRPNTNCSDHDLPYELIREKSEDDFIQRIIIQEPLTESKRSSPIDYKARIVGQMVNEVFVGQKKRVLIVPRSLPRNSKTKDVEDDLIFDVLSVADLEEKQRPLPTNKEVEQYKKDAESSDYFDKIASLFAPNIVGDNMIPIKKALLLAMIGGTRTEGHRGDSHILLIGDPSVGKSQLLRACAAVSHKCILTDGGGSSAAGLTIGMVKRHDGTMIAQAGVLPLCDGGVAIIDEMDKMNQDDSKMIHPGLEDQSVHIAKAGIELTLQTRTTVIAACNPKHSRWNVNLPMRDNINLSPTLLARMDNIFFIPRTFDPIKEGKIATNILFQSKETTSTIFEQNQISTLINFAKTLRPKMLQEAEDYLHMEYVKMADKTKETDLPADGRTLAGLIRIATAHAKLKFKDMITIEDAKVAIQLKKASYLSFGIDLDNETQQTYLPSNQRELNKHETFWLCFNKVANSQGTVSKPEMIELMAESKYFIDVYGAKKFFEKMCMGLDQQLLEGPDGRFRRIS